MVDFRKIGSALGGLGAGLQGDGASWMYAAQRQRELEMMQEEKRRQEAQERQKQTAMKTANYVRTAMDALDNDPVMSKQFIDEIITGIPNAANSPRMARLQRMVTLAATDPGNAESHKRAAKAELQQLDGMFRAQGLVPEQQENEPSSVREWKYFNSLSEEDQQAYLRLQSAGYLNADPQAREVMRQEDVRDIEATALPEARSAATTQQAVGDVETRQTLERSAATFNQDRDLEREAAEPAARERANKAEFDLGRMVSTSDEIRELANSPRTTGWLGARFADVEGSQSYTLRAKLKTLQAYAGFDRLQQMRDESKTGGALGNVSERELGLLISAYAALDPNMGREAFIAELDKFEEQVTRSWESVARAYEQDYGVPYNERAPLNPTRTPEGIDDDMSRYLR